MNDDKNATTRETRAREAGHRLEVGAAMTPLDVERCAAELPGPPRVLRALTMTTTIALALAALLAALLGSLLGYAIGLRHGSKDALAHLTEVAALTRQLDSEHEIRREAHYRLDRAGVRHGPIDARVANVIAKMDGYRQRLVEGSSGDSTGGSTG